MSRADKENPLSAGLGVGLMAAAFTACLPVIFGIFLMLSIGGRFVIDYRFWVWPIVITAVFCGGVTFIRVAVRNLHSQPRRRQQRPLLAPPRRV